MKTLTPQMACLALSCPADSLGPAPLQALAHGEVLALHVRDFIPEETCALIAGKAEQYGYQSYLNVPSVRRIGMAFYETQGKPDLIADYFNAVHRNSRAFRQACAPYVSPIDVLRCALDDAWPAGAHLQPLHGKKMFIGLSRMVAPGTTFLAHHDILAEDAPGQPEAISLLAQFGANVYLQMPDEGGELLMWDREIPSADFKAMRGDDYGVPIASFGKPDLVLRPAPGDLLIFNSRKMHAVSPGTRQNRLAVSCFVGYRGDQAPLTFWS